MCDTNSNRIKIYDQLCDSYHKIDDFRGKLLSLLPLATGTGIFVFLKDVPEKATNHFIAPGIFGFFVTLGLFLFELYGIRKCCALIQAGSDLERDLQIAGHFSFRPRNAAGFINEPLASAVIYPAVMAAWIYLAVMNLPAWAALLISLAVFLVFGGLTLRYKRWIEADGFRCNELEHPEHYPLTTPYGQKLSQ